MRWRCAACGPVALPEAEGSYRGVGCPRCGGPLGVEPAPDAVRFACPRCGADVDADATGCGACGRPLGAGAGRGRCPGCGVGLEPRALGAHTVSACPVCRGLFVDASALDGWVADRASAAPGDIPAEVPFADDGAVRYRRCPRCATLMNRVNFGPGSGVITDVCRDHGVWLDAGELPRILAFAREGGVESAARRRVAEKRARLARPVAPGGGEPVVTPGTGSLLADALVALLRSRG